MRDRVFFGMVAQLILTSFIAMISPKAAIAPALFFFLLGFDAIASGMGAGTAETPNDRGINHHG
jgi:hypothetical protein